MVILSGFPTKATVFVNIRIFFMPVGNKESFLLRLNFKVFLLDIHATLNGEPALT